MALSLSLSLYKEMETLLLGPSSPPQDAALLCSNPQVVLTVYVITTLITSVLVNAL